MTQTLGTLHTSAMMSGFHQGSTSGVLLTLSIIAFALIANSFNSCIHSHPTASQSCQVCSPTAYYYPALSLEHTIGPCIRSPRLRAGHPSRMLASWISC